MENNTERSEPFYLTPDYTIWEKLPGADRVICSAEGLSAQEKQENAQFLLIALNDYANKEVTEKDLEESNA